MLSIKAFVIALLPSIANAASKVVTTQYNLEGQFFDDSCLGGLEGQFTSGVFTTRSTIQCTTTGNILQCSGHEIDVSSNVKATAGDYKYVQIGTFQTTQDFTLDFDASTGSGSYHPMNVIKLIRIAKGNSVDSGPIITYTMHRNCQFTIDANDNYVEVCSVDKESSKVTC